MVRVQFFGQVREIAGGKETEVTDSPTVGSLLRLLSESYGHDFRPETLILLVNGRHIAHIGGAETRLSEGDTVAVFPIIGGG